MLGPEQVGQPTSKPELTPEIPSTKEFEYGFDSEQFRAFRRQILGPKQRAPLEFSLPPSPDPSKKLRDVVTFLFADGDRFESGVVTQEACHCAESSLNSKTLRLKPHILFLPQRPKGELSRNSCNLQADPCIGLLTLSPNP